MKPVGVKRQTHTAGTKVPAVWFVGYVLLTIGSAVSVAAGIDFSYWSAFFAGTGDAHQVAGYTVWNVRLPRTVLAALTGAGLAAAGCLLQGITRNPLADPEIMGVNQGASLFAVAALLFAGSGDSSAVILISAFLGAAVGGSVVYALSFTGRYNTSRMVLAGISVSFFLGSLTTGFIIMRENDLNEILYWMAGKLSGSTWGDVKLALLGIVPSAAAAVFAAMQFNVLTLGEDVATGLGQNIKRVRRGAGALAVVLIGTSVALCGPIGFVGLMVPHIVRSLTGADYRRVIPLSLLLGSVLLVWADLVGQWVLYPADTPVGIITALLGTPFFLYLMRRKKEGWS